MIWTNCKDKLPDPNLPVFCKYKNYRPIGLIGSELIKEYENRDQEDSDNYFWKAAQK